MIHHSLLSRMATFVVATLLFSGLLSAQTAINGTANDTVLPLTPGTYEVTSDLFVPAGDTWTLPPGVILKFVQNRSLLVSGNLAATGAIFTSVNDDSVGVDLSGPGIQNGSPGEWSRLDFNSTSDASVLDGCQIRFTGSTGFAAIRLSNADISILNCTLRDCAFDGVTLANNSFPTISNTSIDNCRAPIQAAPLAALQGFSNNSASGNANGDVISTVTSSVNGGEHLSLVPNNTLNQSGVVVYENNLAIQSGGSLTLGAGLIFKARGNKTFTVFGDLVTNGTAANPVVFTTIDDDDHGGDSSNDGPTSGIPGAWNRMDLSGSASASVLTHTLVRYAGSAGFAGIRLLASTATLDHCQVLDGAFDGLSLDSTARPTISNCSFDQNGRYAVTGAQLFALPGFTNCSASGNGMGDYLRTVTSSVSEDVTLAPVNSLNGNGLFVLTSNLNIANGNTLTLDAGVIFKLAGNITLTVAGTLVTNGTPSERVTITSLVDDNVIGDSNKDGNATAPDRGDWNRLEIGAASTGSTLDGLDLRYAGSSGLAGLRVLGPLVANDCLIFRALFDGISAPSQLPQISTCRIVGCGRWAMNDFNWPALEGLHDNVALNNLGGNYLRLTSGLVSVPVTVVPSNYPGESLVVTTSISVSGAGILTLHGGNVLKFVGNSTLTVASGGSLFCVGTGVNPVSFSSLEDDSVGGDTNLDGNATVPAPGDWNRIEFSSSAGPSLFEHTNVRYAGSSGLAALRMLSSASLVRSVKIYQAAFDGVDVSAAGGPLDNIVVQGARDGIVLRTSVDVRHATVTECSQSGIHRLNGAPQVRNSIAFNANQDYLGFGAGDVRFSMGDTLTSGTHATNLLGNPLFVDTNSEDLNLQPTSPALAAADPTIANLVKKDFRELSRTLDGLLDGTFAPDLGAYELSQYDWSIQGVTQSGTGIDFTVAGPPGTYLMALGLGNQSTQIPPYGTLFAGALNQLFVFGPFPVGAVFHYDLPTDPTPGNAPFFLQGIGIPNSDPTKGNFTSLWRGIIYY